MQWLPADVGAQRHVLEQISAYLAGARASAAVREPRARAVGARYAAGVSGCRHRVSCCKYLAENIGVTKRQK